MQKCDYFNLLWQIDRNYQTRAEFCKAAGINPEELEQELKAGNLSADNVIKAAQALKIPAQEIGFYFFMPISTKQEQATANN